ncbi:unnamed protein product, partial [Phaeothamnion confervicola]
LKVTPSDVVLLLAGDPRQLGPIYRAQNEKDVNARYWLGESLLDDLHIDNVEGLRSQQESGLLTMLTEQSRMTHSICRPISRTYYNSQLTTLADESRPEPPIVAAWPEEGIVLVDPSKSALHRESPHPDKLTKDKKFDEESLFVALELIRRGLKEKARSVLWLTPFRDQAKRAKKLAETHFSNFQVTVGTIHSAQGN